MYIKFTNFMYFHITILTIYHIITIYTFYYFLLLLDLYITSRTYMFTSYFIIISISIVIVIKI